MRERNAWCRLMLLLALAPNCSSSHAAALERHRLMAAGDSPRELERHRLKAAGDSPRELLALAVRKNERSKLTGSEVCRIFKMLVRLDKRWCHRDTAGAHVPGLNSTVLMFHKPFAHMRASIVRAAVYTARRLSGNQAAKLLHLVCTLSAAGFGGTSLCTALAERIIESYEELSPKGVGKAMQACGRLGLCDHWLINAIATRALKQDVLDAMSCHDIARVVDGIACLQARQKGQRVLNTLLEALVCRLQARRFAQLFKGRHLGLLLEATGRLRMRMPLQILESLFCLRGNGGGEGGGEGGVDGEGVRGDQGRGVRRQGEAVRGRKCGGRLGKMSVEVLGKVAWSLASSTASSPLTAGSDNGEREEGDKDRPCNSHCIAGEGDKDRRACLTKGILTAIGDAVAVAAERETWRDGVGDGGGGHKCHLTASAKITLEKPANECGGVESGLTKKVEGVVKVTVQEAVYLLWAFASQGLSHARMCEALSGLLVRDVTRLTAHNLCHAVNGLLACSGISRARAAACMSSVSSSSCRCSLGSLGCSTSTDGNSDGGSSTNGLSLSPHSKSTGKHKELSRKKGGEEERGERVDREGDDLVIRALEAMLTRALDGGKERVDRGFGGRTGGAQRLRTGGVQRGGGGMRHAWRRLGSRTSVDVSMLVAGQRDGRRQQAEGGEQERFQQVMSTLQNLGNVIDRPVLPELPPGVKLDMKREGFTRFDPRADVRTVGGNQSASIRASLLIERDTDLQHRKCVELLELGAVWGQDSRIRNDSLVPPKQRLFVYVSPRRFPIARSSNWNERIIEETDDYIVINKPGGVPSIVRADNAFESCIESAQRLVGPLHVLHRLDVPTHGLMVFAKNRNFKSHFYWEMRAHGVQKRYKALLTDARDASLLSSLLKNDTLITHYMMPSTYSPKVVSPTAQSGWLECRLRIVNVTTLSINDLSSVAARLASRQRAGKGGGKAGGLRKRADLYEVEIELLTGRTHQIRAQLAALGFPVLGDSVYGGKWAMGADKQRKGRQGLEDEALGHLCLQACAITFTQPRESISSLDPGVAGGLCSFWIKGRCSRVVDGTCPFRPCNGTFRFPELAKVNPEANCKLIQLLESEGPFKVMTHTSDEVSNVKESLHYLQKGARNHDRKICDGFQGKGNPFKNDLTRGKGGGEEGKRDRLQFDIDGGSCDDEGEDAVGDGNEEFPGEQLAGNEELRSQTFRIYDPWWRDREKCVEIKQNKDM